MLSAIDKKYFKMCCPDIGKDTDLDISAKCVVCGDSKTRRKHRLHLYEKGGQTYVKCFNCDLSTNMFGFIKTYFPQYFTQYKKETFYLNINNFKDQKEEEKDLNITLDWNNVSNSDIAEVETITNHQNVTNCNTPKSETVTNVINSNTFEYLDSSIFQELTISAKKYINSRHINYDDKFGKFYTFDGILKIKDKEFDLRHKLIIPFYKENKITGFYSRSIYEKQFLTCNLNEGYKIWNYFNIDKEKEVYIFEGIFDAISFYQMFNIDNVIALCSKDIPQERLDELKKPVFCLDSDKTGIKTMLKYALKYKVQIPDIRFKDMNEFLINNVKPLLKIDTGLRAIVELKKLL